MKRKVRNSISNYTRLGYKYIRSLAGNFKNSYYHPKNKSPVRNQMKNILVWLRNKKQNVPIVYKGLKPPNSNVFLKTGVFSTRAPTSTSLSRNVVSHKFISKNKPVILVISPGKYHAKNISNYSVYPAEQEILFPPGKFIKKGVTKNGNYMVNFIERERPLPRRFWSDF